MGTLTLVGSGGAWGGQLTCVAATLTFTVLLWIYPTEFNKIYVTCIMANLQSHYKAGIQ